jgi:hypothetical protein
MYFIITILSFLTVFLSALGLTQVVNATGWHEVTILVTVVSGLVTLIITFLMMFQNMYFRNNIVKEVNQIRRYVKRSKDKLSDLQRYKDEFKKMLTEMYPEYEKDMFSKMAQNDAKQLEIMLVKYPELKFDGILIKYVSGVKERLKSVNDYEAYITSSIKEIHDYNDGGWMLNRVVLPTDIQKLMED